MQILVGGMVLIFLNLPIFTAELHRLSDRTGRRDGALLVGVPNTMMVAWTRAKARLGDAPKLRRSHI